MNDLLRSIKSSDILKTRSLLKASQYLLEEKDDRLGLSPIFHAILQNNASMARVLLEEGANVNSKDEDGNTVLHIAVDNLHTETVRCLLEAGADPSIRNAAGETSLDIAFFRGHSEILSLLTVHENTLEDNDDMSRTSLLIESGLKTIVEEQTSQENSLYSRYQTKLSLNFANNFEVLDLDEPDREISHLEEHGIQVYKLLQEFSIEHCYPQLAKANLGTFKLLFQRTQSRNPLHLNDLIKMGARNHGNALRFLLKVDEIAGIGLTVSVKYPIYAQRPTNNCSLQCCKYSLLSFCYVDNLELWLSLLGLSCELEHFENAGIDLDLLFKLINSRHSVTHELLIDIGISSLPNREVIISRLIKDCRLFIGRALEPEDETLNVNCGCVLF